MAVIAKSESTFHQKHQGSNVQSNGKYREDLTAYLLEVATASSGR